MAFTDIDNPKEYFSVNTWTADDTTPRSFTGFGHQPDLLWVKHRGSASINPTIIDSVRGGDKMLTSATTAAEDTKSHGEVTAFGSDGITVEDGTSATYPKLYFNDLDPFGAGGGEYVCWSWKESATAGFDIVSYTGNGTDDTDISHNLSAVPKMIIIKNRDAADDWQVYHGANTSSPETDYLVLNERDVTADAADRWSDEAPTSSVFTLGDADEVNTDTENYIAYCFAEKQGYSKFGSYIANADSGGDGPFVYIGFRPSFVLVQNTSITQGWFMMDNKRDPFNVVGKGLSPHNSNAEQDSSANVGCDFLSNGFKVRAVGTGDINHTDGNTYIYMAFAEAPFVNSNGVPCNAR